MKGLIIKDLKNLKGYKNQLIYLVLLYGVIGFTSANPSSMIGMLIMVSAIMVMTTFSYDNMAKWEKYGLSLPITRKEMVLSKYLISGIFLMVGIGLGIGLSILFTIVKRLPFNLAEWGAVIAGVTASAIIFLSIMLPVIYKYGVEKCRIAMIIVFAIPFLGGYLLLKSGIRPDAYWVNYMALILGIALVILLILPFVSYEVSCRIFRNKEL